MRTSLACTVLLSSFVATPAHAMLVLDDVVPLSSYQNAASNYGVIEEAWTSAGISTARITFRMNDLGVSKTLCALEVSGPLETMVKQEMSAAIDKEPPQPPASTNIHRITYKVDPLSFFNAARICDLILFKPAPFLGLDGTPAADFPKVARSSFFPIAAMAMTERVVGARTQPVVLQTDPIEYLDAEASLLKAVVTIDMGTAKYVGTSVRWDFVQGDGTLTDQNGRKTTGHFIHGLCVTNCQIPEVRT